MGRVSSWICIAVLGCSSKEDLECEVGDIDGTAEATLDGSAWMATDGGKWLETSENFSISLENEFRNVDLNGIAKDTNGDRVLDLIAEESFPIEVDLSGSTGYGAVFDKRNGLTGYRSNLDGGSGTFVIASVDGDTLKGCFEFVAVSDDDDQIILEVREGQVKIDR